MAKRAKKPAGAKRGPDCGGGPPTRAEKAGKRRAMRVLKAVYLDVALDLRARMSQHQEAMRLLEVLKRRGLEPHELRFIHEHRMEPRVLNDIRNDLADRYGDPRLSKQEIDLNAEGPMLVKIQGGLGWPAPGAARARAAG